MSAGGDARWLARLHDIAPPPAIDGWPPAPAWWLVVALGALLALRIGLALWQRWRKDAYRREGMRQLRNMAATEPAAAVTACARILRRACAALGARDDGTWLDALAAHCPGLPVPERVCLLLAHGPYWPPQRILTADAGLVREFARRWLREHRR